MQTSIIALIAITSTSLLLGLTMFLVVAAGRKPRGTPSNILPEVNRPAVSPSLDYLRQRCRELEKRDLERTVYLELIRIVAASDNLSALAKGVVDTLCQLLKARFGALLWENRRTDHFEFRYNNGYELPAGFAIPVFASIAGECIQKKAPVLVATAENPDYHRIPGQPETAVVCAPIKLFEEYPMVLRVGNWDKSLMTDAEVRELFGRIAPLMSSAFERVLVAQENARRKGQLSAVSAIVASLHKTVVPTEIFLICAKALKSVFNYGYCNIVSLQEGSPGAIVCAVPREIGFDCGIARSRIILRNLAGKPEPFLVEDIRKSELVSGDNKEIGSIMSAPIVVDDSPYASVVLASPRDTPFGAEDIPVLRFLAEQISMTMARALHFGRQEHLALHDGLTGLYNRTYFQETLTQEFERWRRYQRPFSLIMLDVDFFKKCNDTYGHQSGDAALKMVATVLRNALRTVDCPCRYGGEEFAIILRETPLEGAVLLGKRLRQLIAVRPIASDKGTIKITVSGGVAQMGRGTSTVEQLVTAADQALYNSKNRGRNRVSFFERADAIRVSE